MQIYNLKKSGKIVSARATASIRSTAAHLLILSIFVLLLASDLMAESGSGMINRAPFTKATPPPTELEKLSSDLDKIIKSINDLPDEIEDNTVTAEPEKPIEKTPVTKEKTAVPLIAKPEKIAPVKDKTVNNITAKKPNKPVPEKLTTAQEIPQAPTKTGVDQSFLKLTTNGEKLDNKAVTWACVKDVKSGLVWEVKSNNDGIQDKDHLYSWFDPSQQGGITDGGRCKGDISCDTNAYVLAMNKQKLCGHDDWRLPTREEMQSLVYFDSKNAGIRINSNYFPEAMASWYWTASSNKKHSGYAWYVLFRNGISLNDLKERPKHIRLVRTDKKA